MDKNILTAQIGPRIPITLKHDIDIICARDNIKLQDLITNLLTYYAELHKTVTN